MRDTIFGENDFDMFGLRLMCLHGRVVFLTYTAARHQGAMKMFWLGAVMLLLFYSQLWWILNYIVKEETKQGIFNLLQNCVT